MTSDAEVPGTYEVSRRGLHAVAEHVLAAALYQATGHIGLRATPGGFGTPTFAVDGQERQLRIEGVEIVVCAGPTERRAPLDTIGQVAAFVGVTPGAPADVYTPATALDPDALLRIDPAAAAIVHRWYGEGSEALALLGNSHGLGDPPPAQLWPEHFDLAVSIDEVNYGASPGDAVHAEPYAYVGPWQVDGLAGDFWNESFGASRAHHELGDAAAIASFFQTGRDLTSRRGG
jgi:hypothetical protein